MTLFVFLPSLSHLAFRCMQTMPFNLYYAEQEIVEPAAQGHVAMTVRTQSRALYSVSDTYWSHSVSQQIRYRCCTHSSRWGETQGGRAACLFSSFLLLTSAASLLTWKQQSGLSQAQTRKREVHPGSQGAGSQGHPRELGLQNRSSQRHLDAGHQIPTAQPITLQARSPVMGLIT